MSTVQKKQLPNAMACYHPDGLTPTYQLAKKFAGKFGRIVNMKDIVRARMGVKIDNFLWHQYFTSLTAEYYGIGKNGKPILIVAHNVGPMSTIDGIMKAYAWEYKNKSGGYRGGRITQDEFLALEAGKYGEVEVIDLESYCKRYEYPFIQCLRLSEATTDPVLKARLGPNAEQYLMTYAQLVRNWHLEEAKEKEYTRYNDAHSRDGAPNSDPRIIRLEDAANSCYYFGPLPKYSGFRSIKPAGTAICHLLSTSCLFQTEQADGAGIDLFHKIFCYEWRGGAQFIGIKAGDDISCEVHPGPDAQELLVNHWEDLFIPIENPVEPPCFPALMMIDIQLFTQYPRVGDENLTKEPEYLVKSAKIIGKPQYFRTKWLGWADKLRAMAPPEANAYFIDGGLQRSGDEHCAGNVKFYHVEIDVSRRLKRVKELSYDFDLMLDLLNKEL